MRTEEAAATMKPGDLSLSPAKKTISVLPAQSEGFEITEVMTPREELETREGGKEEEDELSPVITTTSIRSRSPFSNEKIERATRTEFFELSEPRGGARKISDTLRKFEEKLLSLEKENKTVNFALRAERESREEEMMKMKAKNQELLKKLRIQDGLHHQQQ